jgi:hypothetical protein
MPHFEPMKKRAMLLDWAIQRELDKEIAEYAPKTVGSAAREMLDKAVLGWIVGLHAEVRPVLEKARAWLEDSLARNETMGTPPSYFAALRQEAHALGSWMLENRSDRTAYVSALELQEAAWAELEQKRGFPASEALELYISRYLRDCIQAQSWDKGVAAHERFGGQPATNAADVGGDAAFGDWACRNRLPRPEAAAEYLDTAKRVFGKGLMEDWLARGHIATAACWLKTIYWESGAARTPEETLLRAYDLMPCVERPPAPTGG